MKKFFYIFGEMCGKVSTITAGVSFISMVLGIISMTAWDFTERNEIKKQQQQK